MNAVSPIAVSSLDIDQQLSALVRLLWRLEREAEGLALDAVGGDAKAAQRLASINADIERAKADRQVFERAKVAALELEAEGKREVEAERAALHYAAARGHARTLLEAANRIDAVIEQFGVLIKELRLEESAIWTKLRLSKADQSNEYAGRAFSGRIGRYGVDATAMANVNNVLAVGDFRNKRSVADIVGIGWRELLEGSDGGAS